MPQLHRPTPQPAETPVNGSPPSEAIPVVIDCDPGHDDALALMLAWAHPRLAVTAITTVAGNQSLSKVTNNALAIATVLGIRDVPIAAGAARPLVRQTRHAAQIHGESGLDGVRLPRPEVELDPRHGTDVLTESVLSAPKNQATIIALGPLTNLALAVHRAPELASHVREVVFMGGAVSGGNATSCAEFNVLADPEAAQIVLSAGWPITMVGLDVTRTALASPPMRDRVRAVPGPVGVMADEILTAYSAAYSTIGRLGGAMVHDPCAVARVIDPLLVEVQPAHIAVELTGALTTGMTVADFGSVESDMNVDVATRLDVGGFWDLLIAALETYAPDPDGAKEAR